MRFLTMCTSFIYLYRKTWLNLPYQNVDAVRDIWNWAEDKKKCFHSFLLWDKVIKYEYNDFQRKEIYRQKQKSRRRIYSTILLFTLLDMSFLVPFSSILFLHKMVSHFLGRVFPHLSLAWWHMLTMEWLTSAPNPNGSVLVDHFEFALSSS